jgi:hypothetical protein
LVGGAGCARRAREGLCAGKRWWEDPRGTMLGRAWLWGSVRARLAGRARGQDPRVGARQGLGASETERGEGEHHV